MHKVKDKVLLSLVESARFPDFSTLYKDLGIIEHRLTSQRKAFSFLKKQGVDFVVAEFFYGYGNNYAGANVSNLDVLFSTLQKYSPNAQAIVLVAPQESQYVAKLDWLLRPYQVLVYPVVVDDMANALKGLAA